jgi:hypothetical protein
MFSVGYKMEFFTSSYKRADPMRVSTTGCDRAMRRLAKLLVYNIDRNASPMSV